MQTTDCYSRWYILLPLGFKELIIKLGYARAERKKKDGQRKLCCRNRRHSTSVLINAISKQDVDVM
jgi:hypothetical protein